MPDRAQRKVVKQIIEDLGAAGMSSDEEGPVLEDGTKTWIIHELPWRSAALTKLLRTLDVIRRLKRYERRGSPFRTRVERGKTSTRRAVPRLPAPCYSGRYIGKLEVLENYALEVDRRTQVDFELRLEDVDMPGEDE